MTVAKKIAFLFSLALGAQFATQCYDIVQIDPYCHVLYFANELRGAYYHVNKAYEVAAWLDEKRSNQYYDLYNNEIVTIIRVIKNTTLSIHSKISVLNDMREQEIAEKDRIHSNKSTTDALFLPAFTMGCMCLMGAAIIADAINKLPLFIIAKSSGITITYRTTNKPQHSVIHPLCTTPFLYS
jgi:hypothetical protein